jgi:hypothetical protein
MVSSPQKKEIIKFLDSSSGSVETSEALNLSVCWSYLNIFFMSVFGGLGKRAITDAIESSAVP